MPEFHIDDKVVTQKGQAFTVTGISRGPKGLLYCGASVGWVEEESLDYDFTEAQRKVLEILERTLWSIRKSGEELEQQLTRTRNEFHGELPPAVRHELGVVRKVLGEAPAAKLPGAVERSDLYKLCGQARAIARWIQEEVVDVQGRDHSDRGTWSTGDLKSAARTLDSTAKMVEEFLT